MLTEMFLLHRPNMHDVLALFSDEYNAVMVSGCGSYSRCRRKLEPCLWLSAKRPCCNAVPGGACSGLLSGGVVLLLLERNLIMYLMTGLLFKQGGRVPVARGAIPTTRCECCRVGAGSATWAPPRVATPSWSGLSDSDQAAFPIPAQLAPSTMSYATAASSLCRQGAQPALRPAARSPRLTVARRPVGVSVSMQCNITG